MTPVRRAFSLAAWALTLCAGLAVVAQALALWRETRIENHTFTRYYDPAREQPDAGGSLADLFEGTGLEDSAGAMETIPNRFMLGLLPAGPGREAISVLTLAGPGALTALLALGGIGVNLRRSSRSAGPAAASGRTP